MLLLARLAEERLAGNQPGDDFQILSGDRHFVVGRDLVGQVERRVRGAELGVFDGRRHLDQVSPKLLRLDLLHAHQRELVDMKQRERHVAVALFFQQE